VTERQGDRRKQLLDEPMEMRFYWKLNEEELDHTLWKNGLQEPMDLS
jgi:hypothetical protein